VYLRGSGIAFDPASGVVPAASNDGNAGVVEIIAILNADGIGAFSGDISIVLDESSDSSKHISYSATCVKHSFELVEASGAIVNEVDFGTHYFGDELSRTFHLFNNGPVEGRYGIMYGTPAEIKSKVDEAEGGSNGPVEDSDNPFAACIMAARQKVSRGANILGRRKCARCCEV
jgi:hypothetical protein